MKEFAPPICTNVPYNERVMLIHDKQENNTCLQALKNRYTIGPKAYNHVSNINH
jgi:hypothetical protein